MLTTSLLASMALTAVPRNVLFIAVDDMRAELGSYGCGHMQTPHLDALAAESLSFDNAYVAVAWCSPSRTVRCASALLLFA